MKTNINIQHVFDCHLHLEKDNEARKLAAKEGNIIFNSMEKYQQFSDHYSDYYQSLIFDWEKNLDFYRTLIDSGKIVCLKIHSRIQKIDTSQYPILINTLSKLERNIPIIYDAFYYGAELAYQPSLSGLIEMVKAFPDRKFVVAHAGGYEILKYFFHLKEYVNVGFDLSFSLQYLMDSSCSADLVKLIRYTDKRRIFFGSDSPHASLTKQVVVLEKILRELALNQEEIDGIFKYNWKRFLGV